MDYHSVGKELAEILRSYHQVPEAKILFQKQSPVGAFKQSRPKYQGNARKKKIRGRGQNLKNHWPLA